MFKEITVQRIAAGSLFKLIGLGLAGVFVPITTIMGVFSLLGVQAITIKWNDQALTGIAGLLSSPFIGLFIAGIFTLLIGSCVVLGLRFYSLFRPITVLAKFPNTSANT